MNLCLFIVRIVSIPTQTLLSGNISLVQMQVQIGKVRKKKKSFDEMEIFIWGKKGNNLMKYYTLGDYIIIEGSLSLKKKKIDHRIYKVAKFTVRKFYPFLLSEEEVSSE